MHTLAVWFYNNVFGNLVASLLWQIPIWSFAMWRFEKRHKRHMQQIHNQISQSLNEAKQ